MKNNFLKLLVLIISSIFCGCKTESGEIDASKETDILHYNVVIVPDLSNRLDRTTNMPDIGILRAIVQNIYPTIATYKRSMNQKDRFSVILSSKKIGTLYNADFSKMTIDLGAFKNQRERIDYLTGNAQGHTLKSDTESFIAEFSRIETAAKQKTYGADIWSLFSSGLDQNLVAPAGESFTYNNERFRNKFRNILILLTDGYIEAGIYGAKGCEGKQCCYLSTQLINNFRQAYLRRTDKKESLQSFFYKNGYGITTANNPYLKKLEVLLLEADDRSLTHTGNATVTPTDFEITKLFWEDWMKKSGIQHFEMHPLARDMHEAEQNILSFMNVR